MKTNLLRISKLPPTLYTAELNLTYSEVIQLFKSKPIYFHLHRNVLYFLGNPELVKSILQEERISVETYETRIDSTFIETNWHILVVLLYKILRYFLHNRGFYFHTRFKNRAFMVTLKEYEEVTLVHDYSDDNGAAFVHEGFTFFFRLYGDGIFLGLDPCVVITRDGKNYISPQDLARTRYEEYKRNFVDKRYNSVTRQMLTTFVNFLLNGNAKIVIPVFNGPIEISGGIVEIG